MAEADGSCNSLERRYRRARGSRQAARGTVADKVNAIQEIAQRRALIAATLLAVNASEFFVQEVVDLADLDEQQRGHRGPRRPAARLTHAAPPDRDDNVVAKSIADLVTPRQLLAMRSVCHAEVLDLAADAARVFGCRAEELSSDAAG